MNVGVIINRKAGATLGRSTHEVAEAIRRALTPMGTIVEDRVASGRALARMVESVANNPEVETIVAAGGDGTVSLAAQHAVSAGKRLLPIPFGTFNLFSRTLGWGGDPVAALNRLDQRIPAQVDVGTVNGLIFVHHVSCGLHPRFIRLREAMRFSSRLGKIVATTRAFMRTARTMPVRRMRIDTGTEIHHRRAIGLAVTVNDLAELPGTPPVPDRTDGGRLAVYVAHGDTMADRLRLIANAVRGLWQHNPSIEVWDITQGSIATGSRRIIASVDGELMRLQPPLTLAIRPRALKVIRAPAA